jgi:hypothetical protein
MGTGGLGMMGGSASVECAGPVEWLAMVEVVDLLAGAGLNGEAVININPTPTTSAIAEIARTSRPGVLLLLGVEAGIPQAATAVGATGGCDGGEAGGGGNTEG